MFTYGNGCSITLIKYYKNTLRIRDTDSKWTSQWARWRLKAPASRLFTQTFIQAQIKENIKPPRHWPLCGEFTGDRWIPSTKGQWCWKCFHLMTSSWCIRSEIKTVMLCFALPWLYNQFMNVLYTHILQGSYSLSVETHCCQSSRSLETTGFGVIIIVSHWNFIAISATPLLMCRSNFSTIGKV